MTRRAHGNRHACSSTSAAARFQWCDVLNLPETIDCVERQMLKLRWLADSIGEAGLSEILLETAEKLEDAAESMKNITFYKEDNNEPRT
jgi:hypothetical protein